MFRYVMLGGIVMVPIGIVSVVALAVVIEKLVTLRKFRKPSPTFIAVVFDAVKKRDWESAQNQCRNFNHPLAGKTLEFDVKIVSIEG